MFKIERSILPRAHVSDVLCMGVGSDDHDTFVRKSESGH